MKFKALFTMLVAASLSAAAQSQGYQDGVEYYKAGQYENAKTILTNTLNDAATNKALANYYLGQTNLALKDQGAAKACFDAGVAADPECPYNYVGLGAIALQKGNDKAAADEFSKALKLSKKNHDVTVAVARAYYNADPVKFAKEIDKYILKAHKDSKNTEPSIYILEGDMAVDKGDIGAAAGKYEMAIGYESNNPEGYVKYANSYFHVNPQYSINKLKEFLQVAPNSALGQRELAEKLYEANFWKQASEQYGKYIQNPNHFPEDKARYSVLLYYGEKYPESLQVAKEVLAQKPDNFLMQRLRFLNEAKLGQNEQAAQDAATFFASNPNGYFTSNDYVTYADVLTALNQNDEAQKQLEIAGEKFPENANVQSSLSDIYFKQKDFMKSAAAIDKYLAASEKPSVNDYYSAAFIYLNAAANADDAAVKRSAADKGVEYVDKAIERAQPNPRLYQRKARLYIAGNGNTPDQNAIDTYGKMIELLDQDPANADASNPQNDLDLYREAYVFSIQYYSDKDKEKAANYTQLVKDIDAKLAK